jgi:hypothetical protein
MGIGHGLLRDDNHAAALCAERVTALVVARDCVKTRMEQPVAELSEGHQSQWEPHPPDATAANDRALAQIPTGQRIEPVPVDEIGFLAVSSGFGDQVGVVAVWRVDEGVIVSLAAWLCVMVS